MKPLLTLLTLLLLSCAKGPRQGYVTATQVQDSAFVAAPFDTLAAYRKAPGKPKTVKVKAYTKKDGTTVKQHYRTPKEG